MKRLLLACAILPTLVATAYAQSCGPNTVTNPEVFQWEDKDTHFFGVLEMGEASFTINGESLTTRAYRQEGGTYSIPGPTIVMTPRQEIRAALQEYPALPAGSSRAQRLQGPERHQRAHARPAYLRRIAGR